MFLEVFSPELDFSSSAILNNICIYAIRACRNKKKLKTLVQDDQYARSRCFLVFYKKIRFFKNHIKIFVLEPLFISNKAAGLQPATLLKSDLSVGIFLFLRTSLGEPLYI